MIADRPLGQIELCSDICNTGASQRSPQHISLTTCERIVPVAQGRKGEIGIDDSFASHYTPDCYCQLVSRRIFQQKPNRAAFHCLAKITASPKGGENYDSTGRQALM